MDGHILQMKYWEDICGSDYYERCSWRTDVVLPAADLVQWRHRLSFRGENVAYSLTVTDRIVRFSLVQRF